MLDPAPSLPLWLDCGLEGHAVQLLAAASLLLAATQLEHFGSPVTKIWSKSAYPVPDLVPHRSSPVPDRSRSFPDRSMESNLMEEEFSGQCKIIWCFWGRIHTDYHDPIHSVPDVRNRRFTKVAVPDVRITAERSRPVYWCIATSQLPQTYRSSRWKNCGTQSWKMWCVKGYLKSHVPMQAKSETWSQPPPATGTTTTTNIKELTTNQKGKTTTNNKQQTTNNNTNNRQQTTDNRQKGIKQQTINKKKKNKQQKANNKQ